jgi:hypothetical protein
VSITVSVKLVDKGLKRITKSLMRLDGMRIEIGYLGSEGGAIHPDSKITVAHMALIHIVGVDDVPRRDFMTSALRLGTDQLEATIAAELRTMIAGNKDAVAALSVVGQLGVKLIRDRLNNAASWADPLEAETIEDKGGSKPLDATGTLERSLSWRVMRLSSELARGK